MLEKGVLTFKFVEGELWIIVERFVDVVPMQNTELCLSIDSGVWTLLLKI